MARKKARSDEIVPIPASKRKEWDELIAESIKIVNELDKGQFELVFIVAQVRKQYGESTIERWSEEIGISYRLARQFKYLAEKKVDRIFVGKWKGLSYSLILETLTFCGGINPTAEHFLSHALEHRLSVRANAAYMRDYFAPPLQREEAADSYKLMLKEKQELEGFSDVVKFELERIIEKNPEFEPAIVNNAITDAESLTALKIAAGVMSAEEAKIVDEARIAERKLHSQYRYMRDHETELFNSIIYGHELSGVLRERLLQINKILGTLLEAYPNETAIENDTSIEMEI